MSRCFVFLLSWVGWLGWLRRGGEGTVLGTKGGGKERRKRASSAPWISAKSWGYSAFQYILPDLTPKTNRCASRFATTASALRASAVNPGRRGVPILRNFPGKFGRHTDRDGRGASLVVPTEKCLEMDDAATVTIQATCCRLGLAIPGLQMRTRCLSNCTHWQMGPHAVLADRTVRVRLRV